MSVMLSSISSTLGSKKTSFTVFIVIGSRIWDLIITVLYVLTVPWIVLCRRCRCSVLARDVIRWSQIIAYEGKETRIYQSNVKSSTNIVKLHYFIGGSGGFFFSSSSLYFFFFLIFFQFICICLVHFLILSMPQRLLNLPIRNYDCRPRWSFPFLLSFGRTKYFSSFVPKDRFCFSFDRCPTWRLRTIHPHDDRPK